MKKSKKYNLNKRNKKIALITGITGQDGSYLAEFLLSRNYIVHGIKRRTSLFNTQRIENIYQDPHIDHQNFFLHFGDLVDSNNITRIIQEILPDEIYNLGAQSHVAVSFDNPEYTANVNALGTLRILESIRILELQKKTKFYQASSSELFGLVKAFPQDENTPFNPRSPYAVSKLFSYWTTINYRETYKIFACNGILFNHESKRRGETFVTRKITRGLANIALGTEKCIHVGNLEAKRDWGHAKEYVQMQWLMLQQSKPEDYVISTGIQKSVRDFIEICTKYLGLSIKWVGSGKNEKGIVTKIKKNNPWSFKINQVIIKVDKRYFRPLEVDNLLGDSTKARKKLGWKPKINIEQLVKEMIDNDIRETRRLIL